MSLKELTWENHKNAERKKFAGILMSGEITPQLYHKYLYNQFLMYSVLETRIDFKALGIDGIQRAGKIFADLFEIQMMHGIIQDDNVLQLPVSKSYIEYIAEKTPEELLAHVYVRHFGDMYGGAMIAKKVPGSGTMYQFENKDVLKERTRALLNDEMADEANRCFEFAIRLFEELVDE
jgi:heme oxygenase